jgi:hypothetical protein
MYSSSMVLLIIISGFETCRVQIILSYISVCCIALVNLLRRYVATLTRQCGEIKFRKTGEIFILHNARALVYIYIYIYIYMCVCVSV